MKEALEKRRSAQMRYCPKTIKWLLIAEAPPSDDRYIYFEEVDDCDYLYLGLARALYDDYGLATEELRKGKGQFLHFFMEEGFFIIDSLEDSIGPLGQKARKKMVKDNVEDLVHRVRSLGTVPEKVILIKATTFQLAERLAEEGWEVINTESIDFPSTGCQVKFHEKFQAVLSDHGYTFENGRSTLGVEIARSVDRRKQEAVANGDRESLFLDEGFVSSNFQSLQEVKGISRARARFRASEQHIIINEAVVWCESELEAMKTAEANMRWRYTKRRMEIDELKPKLKREYTNKETGAVAWEAFQQVIEIERAMSFARFRFFDVHRYKMPSLLKDPVWKKDFISNIRSLE